MIGFRLASINRVVTPPPVAASVLRMAVVNAGNPNNMLYKLDGTTLQSQGSLPNTQSAGNASGISFTPDSQYCAVGTAAAPYVEIFKRAGNVWTKLANPSVTPTGASTDVSFSYDGKYLAVGHFVAPFLTVYKRDGDVFTKLPDISPAYSVRVQSVAFSPKSNHLVCTFIGAPYTALLTVTDSGVTQISGTPTGGPTWYTYDVAFSSDGSLVGFAWSRAPFYSIFNFNPQTGYGAKITDGDSAVSNTRGIAFTKDNKYVALAAANSAASGQTYGANLSVFPIANGAIGTALSTPNELLPGFGFRMDFMKDTYTFAVSHNTTPFVTLLEIQGTSVVKSAIQPDINTTNNAVDVQFYLTSE